jgi:putative phosphoesterase
MITVGVISDTHIHGPDNELPAKVFEIFEDVDIILHAGDLTSPELLEELGRIAPVEAVKGNMDSLSLRKNLPSSKLLHLGSQDIGLIHGWGPPGGIRDRIREKFGPVGAIVYGHTHTPFAGLEGGVYFFNPGSTSRRPPGVPTVGKLWLGGGIKGEIIPL